MRSNHIIRKLLLVSGFLLAIPARAMHAQGTFVGTWTITEWMVAPWVKAADRASIKPNSNVLKHSLIFTSKHIVGPTILSCDAPQYRLLNFALDMLFEGGLTNAKADGAALGFKAPVKTLQPGCDFDFHMRDPDTVLFALDNVLYTMKRKNPAPK